MQPGAAAHDVGDRVEPADLVEVHVVDRDAVDRCLGMREPGEDVERVGAHRVAERCGLQQRAHVGPGARGGVVGDLDVDLAGADPGADDVAAHQPHRLGADRVDAGLQHVELDACVDECTQQHVAADAGRAVEPADHCAVRRATRAAKTPALKPLSMLTTVMPGAQALSIASSAARPPKLAP